MNKYMNSGNHSLTFVGENYSSGIYFYTIKTGNQTDIKKMILTK